jgi:Spy/CpxP family protein refolding chaperone
MKKAILIFCLCFLLLPVAASAQGQGDRIELAPWWDRPVVQTLRLSAEQREQIRAIIRDSRDRLIQLRAAVQSAEAALADEFAEETINKSKADMAIDKVVTARAELMRAVSQMSLKLRQVLTYRQWQRLAKRNPKLLINPLQERQRIRRGY